MGALSGSCPAGQAPTGPDASRCDPARKLKVLSLFAGIGGFDLGLERTGGFETVRAVEIDPDCQAVLRKRFPLARIDGDITECSFEPAEAEVICGGFPCQDISSLGKRAGLAGERSGLWREMLRAIRVVRPSFVIVENVADLIHRGLAAVAADLASSGYDLEWDCIPARAVGAPHGRDRIWIVAYPNGRRWRPDISRRNDANGPNAGRAQADGLPGAVFEQRDRGQMARATDADDKRRLQPGGCFSEIRRRLDDRSAASPEWATPWPEKLSQIQGMDDGLSDRLDKAGVKQTGNAVVPQIPELIGRAILSAIAAATGTAKTAKQAECEASQSGAEGNRPRKAA